MHHTVNSVRIPNLGTNVSADDHFCFLISLSHVPCGFVASCHLQRSKLQPLFHHSHVAHSNV